jgi:hypothetical protein
VRAARNERYVVSRRSHSRAEISSNRTRSHDCNPHFHCCTIAQ